MTPNELDAIRRRAADDDSRRVYFAGTAERDRAKLLSYVDQLHTEQTIADGNWPALTAHLRAVVTELSHHGDMTPTAKRVLMNVLDGVE